MKILVTGGAGFVGSNLVNALITGGHTVHVVDNMSTGSERNKNLQVVYFEESIEFFNFERLKQYNYDYVYHLAAKARIAPSFDDPIDYYESNVMGTIRVAQFCVDINATLIFAGSSSVHSGQFANPYTFSKVAAEDALRMWESTYGLKYFNTRFYNVYGPNHLKNSSFATLLGVLENNIETKSMTTIYGDGLKTRDFTHVDDVVDALLAIMTRLDKTANPGVTFEIGRGEPKSIGEIVKLYRINKVRYTTNKPGEARHTLCNKDARKFVTDKLNVTPHRNVEDYIKNYLSTK